MKIIRSAAVVLAAFLLALVPALANADARTHYDAAGDVQYFVNSDPSNVPPPIAAPSRAHGDITAFRVTNGTSSIRVVVYFRSLGRANQFHGHVFRFVNGTLERKVQVAAGPSPLGWSGQSEMSTTSGNRVSCSGMNHQLDYTRERLILNVPSSCLGRPAYIRVGTGTYMLVNDKTYFDDGYRTRGDMGVTALKPTLGPRVAR